MSPNVLRKLCERDAAEKAKDAEPVRASTETIVKPRPKWDNVDDRIARLFT